MSTTLFDAPEVTSDKPSFAERLRAKGYHPDQLGDAPALGKLSQDFIDKFDGGKKPRRRRTQLQIAADKRKEAAA